MGVNWWIVGGVAIGVVVLLVLGQRFRLFDLLGRTKSKSSGSSSIMGIGDEVFAPSRHEAAVELDRQTVLPAPAPVAGDGDKGISESGGGKSYRGHLTIDLSQREKPRS